ncbi:MAG: gamma carbonic anhydrase family protein [Deltaproteobacteria bacterium]|nr:gamma carbonic anhydrase family protein [Deltaproteobacteria bacterium]
MQLKINLDPPRLDSSVFVAPGAVVLGDVELGPRVSVWYGCVIRGDVNWIRVGARTNLQDGTIIHVAVQGVGTWLGQDVVVGHRVVLHSCRLEDHALVGNGAVVLDRAVVGQGSFVAAGAVVPPGMQVPPGVMVAGVPAKVIRELGPADQELQQGIVARYLEVMEHHRRFHAGQGAAATP